jgi:hypothetical protein
VADDIQLASERGSILALEPCILDDFSSSASGLHPQSFSRKRSSQPPKLQSEAAGMALQVLIAHTGQRLQAEPGSFTS